MSSTAQIQANRLNSQKSTGPRSPEGKAVSRCNALQSGIHARLQVIPGEGPAELEVLTQGYHQEFQPATPTECFLVDSLIRADWQLRRLHRLEAQLWSTQLAEMDPASESPLGQVFRCGPRSFQLLQRRLDATERSYYRALKELQRIHRGADSEPAPGPWPPAPAEAAAEVPAAKLASFFPVFDSTLASPPLTTPDGS